MSCEIGPARGRADAPAALGQRPDRIAPDEPRAPKIVTSPPFGSAGILPPRRKPLKVPGLYGLIAHGKTSLAQLTSAPTHSNSGGSDLPRAQMAELVDALVSGTSAARRGGSSPLPGTKGLAFTKHDQSTPMATPTSSCTRVTCRRGSASARAWRSTPRRSASIHTATGCASCSCPPATAPRISCRSSRRHVRRAAPKGAAHRPQRTQDLPFRPLRHRGARKVPRRADRADLLHQNRLQARAHLHRPPRPQGSLRRAARARNVQAAAKLRLGAPRNSPSSSSPMPRPTCCICMP